jgi:hypothetical protein
MKPPFFLCALAILLAACRPVAKPMPDLFPETAGLWRRTSIRELQPTQAPDPVPRASIERIRAATYEGPGKLEARIYQMSTSAVALDLVQRWQTAPDTVFFYADRFFVIVRWEAAERKELQEFVGVLEKRLNAKQ